MIGQIIAAKYKVIQELGSGHSGTVYLALDPYKQNVAVKCLTSEYNEKDLKRFQEEFVTLRSLTHPHIAQPLDFGYDSEIGQYFFVTEYIKGRTLNKAFINKKTPQRLEYMVQILEALDYMHRQGLYHCDIKPANILVTDDEDVKIIDFDVATRGTKVIGGTPSYFPPEILADPSLKPNPKTDIYSLGATFYRCLTKKKPYSAKTISDLRKAHQKEKPSLPSELDNKLEDVWNTLIMGMIHVNPSQRYSTASAILQQIYPLLGNKQSILSKDEILYRLSQRGISIGKEKIIDKVKDHLKGNYNKANYPEKIWLIESQRDCGATSLMDEIKTEVQLAGLKCYQWNRYSQNYPNDFPFVWIIDDIDRIRLSDDSEKWQDCLSFIKEIVFKGQEQSWWIILGGVAKKKDLPQDLQTILQDNSHSFELKPWSLEEVKKWLEDIFQSKNIPHFLLNKIYESSNGIPQKCIDSLRNYLSRGLILNENGHWIKDLYSPSQLFIKQFDIHDNSQGFSIYDKLNQSEKKLITIMSLLYEPMPVEFFVAYFGNIDLLRDIRKLESQSYILDKNGSYFISHHQLKNEALRALSEKEKIKIYDQLSQLATDTKFHSFFSQEAHYYYQAHASNKALAYQAWDYFGELYLKKGLWNSALKIYEEAEELIPQDNLHKKIELSIKKGRCLIPMLRLEEAEKIFQKLLSDIPQLSNQNSSDCAKIYERLGVIALKKSELSEARGYFEKGLEILGDFREPLDQYLALRNFLASIDMMENKFEQAIQDYEETYILSQRLPPEKRRILTNNDLGYAYLKSGQNEKAIEHWLGLIQDLESRDDKTPLIRVYYQLGQSYLNNDEDDKALQFLEKAKQSSQGLQNFEMELRIFNALANLYNKENKDDKALEMYEKALECTFQVSEPYSTAVILINMGALCNSSKQFAQAKHALNQAINYLSTIEKSKEKHTSLYQIIYRELAKASAELLQAEDSLDYAEKSHKLSESTALSQSEEFETLLTLWQAYSINKDKENSIKIEQILKEKAINQEEKQSRFQKVEMENQRLRLLIQKRGTQKKPSLSHKNKKLSPKINLSKTATTLVLKDSA